MRGVACRLLTSVVPLLLMLEAPLATFAEDGSASAASAKTATVEVEQPSGRAVGESWSMATLLPTEPVYGDPAYLRLPGGTVVSPESFYSPALERQMAYEVILPPGYVAGDRAYPVLYLLHGYAGWSHSWIELGLHQTADFLWLEGGLRPFIVVLPEGGNSYYLNHAYDGERWADYIVEDLVPHVDATYRTLPASRFRAIGGLSMGGDGALQLGLNHPDVFGVVGAHSPTTRLTYDDAPGDLYGDEAYWEQHNPLWLIGHGASAERLAIWIDMGDEDDWIWSSRAVHEVLEEQGVAHEYREYAGGHTGEYWLAHSLDYLRFYAGAFPPDVSGTVATSAWEPAYDW